MAKFLDKQKALVLRKKGQSYSQIKKELKVSKSTLSIWLKDYPLSKQRIKELRDCNEQRIERYRETMRAKKEKRLSKFFCEQKKLIFPLNKREIFIAGLFLYWGEGAKSRVASLCLANTDPSVINFFINWLKILGVQKENLRVHLHLYNDMKINQEIAFWSKITGLTTSQFNKPYIKKSLMKNINHKGAFGHGTCCISYGNARLSEKILMAIKAISNKNYAGM